MPFLINKSDSFYAYLTSNTNEIYVWFIYNLKSIFFTKTKLAVDITSIRRIFAILAFTKIPGLTFSECVLKNFANSQENTFVLIKLQGSALLKNIRAMTRIYYWEILLSFRVLDNRNVRN